MRKLSARDRKKAIELRLSGRSQSEIAAVFGVTRQCIQLIVPSLPPEKQAELNERRFSETHPTGRWTEAEDDLLRLLFVNHRKTTTWIALSGQLKKRTLGAIRDRVKTLQLSLERNTTPQMECSALKLPELRFLKRTEPVAARPQITYSHITASLMGDPPPQRSALYARTKQESAA